MTLNEVSREDALSKYSQKIVDQLRKFGTHLSFSVTQRCPLECDHCITNSRPSNNKALDLSDQLVVRICNQLGEVKGLVRQLSLTGGEPFLRTDIMQRIAAVGADNSMHVGAVTSGYWATSSKSADFFLRKVPDVQHLTMSYDVYHSRYISEESVETFVEAAEKHGKTCSIRVSIRSNPEADEAELFDRLTEQYGDLVHKQEIVPFGRAADIVDDQSSFSEAPSLPCLSSGPHIYYNGNSVPCCSALRPNIDEDHPLNLGNASDFSLKELISSANKNVLLNLIRLYGFDRIHSEIVASHEGSEKRLTRIHSDSQCSYCAKVMHTPAYVKTLESAIFGDDLEIQVAYQRFLFDGNDESLKTVIERLRCSNHGSAVA